MTEADAKIKLVREIERGMSDFGLPSKPGLATFLAGKLLSDIPGLMEAVKQSARGKVS